MDMARGRNLSPGLSGRANPGGCGRQSTGRHLPRSSAAAGHFRSLAAPCSPRRRSRSLRNSGRRVVHAWRRRTGVACRGSPLDRRRGWWPRHGR
ncbi:hypothetical protein D5S18_11840 [Nocardia panacis]|uniref:Uncharacterized protein n=1 Tax=Nocardia panacis TaxID=2340916 RepID=A0A3A4KDW3_9NOCA|nr:hypothetical protein D5S18_11840 [Nocardia panacis]